MATVDWRKNGQRTGASGVSHRFLVVSGLGMTYPLYRLTNRSGQMEA
jgi:hypothetical protein